MFIPDAPAMHLAGVKSIGLDVYDSNGDGIINGQDCPYQFNSAKAKLWWKQVMEPHVQDQVTPEMKAKYGAKVTGAFEGKALVKGVGANQGDFNYLVNKLQVV